MGVLVEMWLSYALCYDADFNMKIRNFVSRIANGTVPQLFGQHRTISLIAGKLHLLMHPRHSLFYVARELCETSSRLALLIRLWHGFTWRAVLEEQGLSSITDNSKTTQRKNAEMKPPEWLSAVSTPYVTEQAHQQHINHQLDRVLTLGLDALSVRDLLKSAHYLIKNHLYSEMCTKLHDP